jgi:hypothetical protein
MQAGLSVHGARNRASKACAKTAPNWLGPEILFRLDAFN